MTSQFWEDVCDEHGITPVGTWCGEHDLQLQKINAVFSAGPIANYIPRAVLVDLDTAALDMCRTAPFGRIFNPDSFVFPSHGGDGAGNNYARGFHHLGPYILEDTLDVIRREVERCDWLVGFQMVGSVGGGTGSAMSSLLLPHLHDQYPKNALANFGVMPSVRVSDTVVEPYNAILSFPALIDHSELTISLDNEALYDICTKTLRLNRPTLDDLNYVMAKVMSGLSATYRFPARNHLSWRVLRCLAPSPKLHFFVPGFVPLASRAAQPFTSVNVQTITSQMLSGEVLMSSVQKHQGVYLSAAALFRGCHVYDLNVNELLCRYEAKHTSQFVEWMPYHFMKGICLTPPRGLPVSATFLANHTSTVGMWNRLLDRYSKLFKRKAFLHWYTGEGMSLDDFKLAEEGLRSLIGEYKAAEKGAPKGWKSPEDNPVFKKTLEQEKLMRVVEIVTIQPTFRVLKAFRNSVQCYQILSLEC